MLAIVDAKRRRFEKQALVKEVVEWLRADQQRGRVALADSAKEVIDRVHSQGFKASTPIGSKSRTLRVTTVMRWTKAAAAIKASRMGLGSGTCNFAQRSATATSTGSIRPSNSATSNALSLAAEIFAQVQHR